MGKRLWLVALMLVLAQGGCARDVPPNRANEAEVTSAWPEAEAKALKALEMRASHDTPINSYGETIVDPIV